MGDEKGSDERKAGVPDPLKELVEGIMSGDRSAAEFFESVLAENRVHLFEAFAHRGKAYKKGLEGQRFLRVTQLFCLQLGIWDHMTLREVLGVFEEGVEESPDKKNKAFIQKLIRRAYKKMGLHGPETHEMTKNGIYDLIQKRVITLQEVEQLINIAQILGISFAHLLQTPALRSPIKSLSAFSRRLRNGTFDIALDFGIRKLRDIKPDIDISLVRGDFFNRLPKLLQAVSKDEDVRCTVTDMTGLSFLIQEVLTRIPGLIHKIPKDNAEETLTSGITYREFLSAASLVLKAIQRRIDQYLLRS